MSDPYRSPSTVACPTCSSPLLAPDRDGVRGCPQQCGEWAGRATIDRLWGPIVATPSDPKLRWRGGKPFPCVVCGVETRRLMHPLCTRYLCDAHGVWFHKASRRELEELFANKLAVFRTDLRAVEAVSRLLHQVRNGDMVATDALARRWVALERRLHEVTARLDQRDGDRAVASAADLLRTDW